MQNYRDHPIINQVESVLISTQPAVKKFSSSKSLTQSKHTTDSNERLFYQPSTKCLKQIIKINPIQVKSLENSSNSNIKAFIYVSLENAINSYDDNFYEYMLQQIQNKQVELSKVSGHPHTGEQPMMIKTAIIGFLKSLKMKRIKNTKLVWQKQLENTPIIMDYLVIFCRAALTIIGQQNAGNYFKQLPTRSVIQKLSQYFDINCIERQHFFLFQQNELFIYQSQNCILFGRFGKKVVNRKNQDNPQSFRIDNKYNNYSLKILQNSTESLGSNMVSSRHNEQKATPFFNVVTQEQTKFNFIPNPFYANNSIINECVEEASSHLFLSNGSKKQILKSKNSPLENSKPDSITSSTGFHINVFSQEKNLCQKAKYHKDAKTQLEKIIPVQITHDNKKQKNKNTIHKEVNAQEHFENYRQKQNQKQQNKNKPFAQIVKPIYDKKSFFAAKKYSQEDFSLKQIDKFKAFIEKSQNCNSQQAFKRANTEQFDIKTRNFQHDCKNWPMVFDWQNDQRRLMRVQSVSYKTCGTCNRRFYRNQITPQVFEVSFKPIPQQKPAMNKVKKQVQIRQTPKFTVQRFHKKSADTVILQNITKIAHKFTNNKSLKWLQMIERKRSPHNYVNGHPQQKPRNSVELKVNQKQEQPINSIQQKPKANAPFMKLNSKQNLTKYKNNTSKSPLLKKESLSSQNLSLMPKKAFQPYEVKKLNHILSFKSPKSPKNNSDQTKNNSNFENPNNNQNRVRKSPDNKVFFCNFNANNDHKDDKHYQKYKSPNRREV